jgi:hypothetical protein
VRNVSRKRLGETALRQDSHEVRSNSTPYDPKSLEEFVNGMEAIVSAELAEWREGLLSGNIAGKLTSSTGEP